MNNALKQQEKITADVQVFNYLKTHGSIGYFECLKVCGSRRLEGRIFNIRQWGEIIIKTLNKTNPNTKKVFGRYFNIKKKCAACGNNNVCKKANGCEITKSFAIKNGKYYKKITSERGGVK